MQIKKTTKKTEVLTIKVADSTVRLITKNLIAKLGITLPLCKQSIDILAEYFEAEEISLAQDQADDVPYDEQYMLDICRAVDDFSPCGDNAITDINDLNERLHKQND